MQTYTHSTPFGALQLTIENEIIHCIKLPGNYSKKAASPAPKAIAQQLDAYFANADSPFELPLYKQGTDFQQRVWRELRKIPRGQSCDLQTPG